MPRLFCTQLNRRCKKYENSPLSLQVEQLQSDHCRISEGTTYGKEELTY